MLLTLVIGAVIGVVLTLLAQHVIAKLKAAAAVAAKPAATVAANPTTTAVPKT